MPFKTSARCAFFTAAMAVAFFHQAAPALAQCGKASWYAEHGRTASGERMKPGARTAAHRTLPFGTVVRVTNLQNGLATTGTVQDRGPWTRGRIADLSPRIARHLDMIRSGIARVEIVPVELAEAAE